jgi:tRNA threonylcarbamoyladenosine biosynthesis protein TsaE
LHSLVLDLPDESATTRLGQALANTLRPGDAVCLWGPLGAGKSTLARGLVRALTSPDEDVPSPTFTLAQVYEGREFQVTHFDLYRIEDPDETFEIGLEEAIDAGAAIIEWPERLERHLPHHRLDIRLSVSGDGRRAEVAPHGAWKERELAL